jgi:hypothetical protein
MPFTVRDWVTGETITEALLENLESRLGAYIDSQLAAHSAATANTHGISSFALIPIMVVHNGTSYPSRPAGPTIAWWLGPTEPPIGGGTGAVENDVWIQRP